MTQPQTTHDQPMRIAIVAGETSGDLLGSGLIEQLTIRFPDAVFEGVAGPKMIAAGCQTLFPMEQLSVMGIGAILKRLPELLGLRRGLVKRWRGSPPDLFIGIDAPEFNLGLAGKLHASGIPTVHYVSPTIWAWRPGRIKKIQRAVDLMLCLFPFEVPIYQPTPVTARCVGHPLADSIPRASSKTAARAELGLAENGKILAVLPGSRGSELGEFGEILLQASAICQNTQPGLQLIAPMANQQRRSQFEKILKTMTDPPKIILIDQNAQQCIAAADCVLVASGTATLEVTLIKRPMVVAYRVAPVSYQIFSRLLKVTSVSLPNLLAGEPLVPELIQHDCTPEKLASALTSILDSEDVAQRQVERFAAIHDSLALNADQKAAEFISNWWSKRHQQGHS